MKTVWECPECGHRTLEAHGRLHNCKPPSPAFTAEAPALTLSGAKVRLDLSSPIADAGTAEVFTQAARTKYKAHDWRAGLAWSKRIASLKRHLALFEAGADYDAHLADCPANCSAHSELPHVDHIGASAVMLQEFFRTRGEFDDRYKISAENQQALQRVLEGKVHMAAPSKSSPAPANQADDLCPIPPATAKK